MTCDATLSGFLCHQSRPIADTDAEGLRADGSSRHRAAYRRAACDEVDGLDEHLFAYNGDFDLGLRLGAGWRTVAARRAPHPPRRSSSSATRSSHAISRPAAGACAAGARHASCRCDAAPAVGRRRLDHDARRIARRRDVCFGVRLRRR
jgi:hypothetical protein